MEKSLLFQSPAKTAKKSLSWAGGKYAGTPIWAIRSRSDARSAAEKKGRREKSMYEIPWIGIAAVLILFIAFSTLYLWVDSVPRDRSKKHKRINHIRRLK